MRCCCRGWARRCCCAGRSRCCRRSRLGLGAGVEIERDFDAALRPAQVAMMLRIQKERLAGLELDLADYIARYQLNGERLAAHAPDALVMHPGPMIRGLEIAGEVADGPQLGD